MPVFWVSSVVCLVPVFVLCGLVLFGIRFRFGRFSFWEKKKKEEKGEKEEQKRKGGRDVVAFKHSLDALHWSLQRTT